ncbi:hypothetical protein STEG23_023929 [Scotinomys teguina]
MGLRIIMRRKICQTRKTNAMCTIHSLAFHGFRSSSYDPINLTRTICVVIGLRLPIRAWAVDELFLCRLSAASKVTDTVTRRYQTPRLLRFVQCDHALVAYATANPHATALENCALEIPVIENDFGRVKGHSNCAQSS